MPVRLLQRAAKALLACGILGDLIIGSGLCVIAGVISWFLSLLIGTDIFREPLSAFWFEADVPRVVRNLTNRYSDHYRTSVHPLFSFFVATPTIAMTKFLGLSAHTALKIEVVTIAVVFTAAFFALLRFICRGVLDAAIFCALFISSAAFLFWFSVPETYSWGAFSIILPILLLAKIPRWHHQIAFMAASAFSLSITVTNWMSGLVATALSQPLRQAARLTIYAFAVVAALSTLQYHIYPDAGRLLYVGKERYNVAVHRKADHIPTAVTTFVVNSMIAPEVSLARLRDVNREKLSFQTTRMGSGGVLGLVAVVLWIVLLAIGFRGLFRCKEERHLRMALALVLSGQFLLHLVYGFETFLYAAHFVPLLVATAAFACRTSLRRPALVLATSLVLVGGLNNALRFQEAMALLSAEARAQLVPGVESDDAADYARGQVIAAMFERPADPWPRGTGHIPMAQPGTNEREKAYLEPGGGFSPSVGSFGVSLWILDEHEAVAATSDSLPLEDIRQEFRTRDAAVPSVLTETSFYRADWTHVAPGHWQLRLMPSELGAHLAVAIRSVGPAGGPIIILKRERDALWINNRWQLTASPALNLMDLGEEGDEGWTTSRSSIQQVETPSGWGYARLAVNREVGLTLDIRDMTASTPWSPLAAIPVRSGLDLDLPDRAFVDSIEAQVSHLMMGLVGTETRPGDPMNYPLAWQRDGAYVVVALTKAGRIDAARILVDKFAEEDFFGGFGAEADAPGLSLWAIETVARAVTDPAFDTKMWPHVRRKAEFILQMLEATDDIRAEFRGPVVPHVQGQPDLDLVAKRAKDGLIAGKMDWHYPLLFVNGVSYRGLMDAAAFAQRIGDCTAGTRWSNAATELRAAWGRSFTTDERKNARTLASGLWPTFAVDDRDAFEDLLSDDWDDHRRAEDGGFFKRPRWTYFEVAKAHQWLYLGNPDRAWATLRWFWKNSPSPGLYTLWEGDGEESPFSLWEDVRGWVDPPPITPHYWSAAEMLSLQTSMLAYLDRGPVDDALVVGGGVPPQWLGDPIHVRGVVTDAGIVDWSWDTHSLRIKLAGPPVAIRPGIGFPDTAEIITEFEEGNTGGVCP